MKFEYTWTKDDLKKELERKRFKTNLVFFLIGILLYYWIMSEGLRLEYFDNKVIFLGFIIFLAFLVFFLFFVTKIYIMFSLKKNDKNTNMAYGVYKVSADDKKIVVKIQEQSIKYNYSEINKFRKRRGYFFISTKEDKIGLIFKKKVIGIQNYNKLLQYLTKYIGC